MAKNKPFPKQDPPPAILKAFGASLVIFAAGFLVFKPYFMTNDDALMAMLAKGVGIASSPCGFLLFINVLAGRALKGLYGLAPAVPWYGLFLYFVFFLSLWGLLTVVLNRVQGPKSLALAGLVLVPAFFHCFAQPQYTLYSFLAGETAVFIFYFLNLSRFTLGLGLSLIFLSGLLRLNATLLALTTSIPLLLYAHWKIPFRAKTREWKIFGLAAFLLLFAPYLADRMIYRSHPNWQDARRAVAAHSELVEFKMPDYGGNQLAFQEAGWSLNDYALFIRWYWLDPKFALEKVEKLARWMPYNFLEKFQHWKKSIFSGESALLTGTLLVLFFAAPPSSRPLVAASFLWVALQTMGLTAFFKIPAWILLPQLYFCCLLCLLLPESRPGNRKPSVYGMTVLVLAVLALLSFKTDLDWNRTRRSAEKSLVSSMKALVPSPNQLYVVWNGQLPFEDVSVFGDWDLFRNFNSLWLSWAQSTPPQLELLSRFHLEKPLLDLVNRPDVYLIYAPGQSGVYQGFLGENGGGRITPEMTYSGNLFSVYRIHAAKGATVVAH